MSIKIENVEVVGWEHVIRGMRNPKNSWELSDSVFSKSNHDGTSSWVDACGNCLPPCACVKLGQVHENNANGLLYEIGENDHDLMMRLAKGGPVHAKYRRMITVYLDITAPLYWWKEFDTYKVGTVANSCSTMHKIHDKEFTLEDFSYEHLMGDEVDGWNHPGESTLGIMWNIVDKINECRDLYLKTKNKKYWWQMIQLLPSSYNQKRTIMLNYEVLAGIYPMRKNHKLDEWREFCKWIESLPYSEIITTQPPKEMTAKEFYNELIDRLNTYANRYVGGSCNGHDYPEAELFEVDEIYEMIERVLNGIPEDTGEQNVKKDEELCKNCNGTGMVQVAPNARGIKKCPVCNGNKVVMR